MLKIELIFCQFNFFSYICKKVLRMYSIKELSEIISRENFSTKICFNGEDFCLAMIPNYSEYNYLFGGEKTKTCYAHGDVFWKEYHTGVSREMDFLSISPSLDFRYRYLTLCFRNIEIDEKTFRKNNWSTLSGSIVIHDLEHLAYPTVHFRAKFLKTREKFTVLMDFADVNLYSDFGRISMLYKLESDIKFHIIEEAITYVCEDVLKKEFLKYWK